MIQICGNFSILNFQHIPRFSEWSNAFNLCYATSSTNYDVAYEVTCLALWRWINCVLCVSPSDYWSCRLIQVFCYKYSFVSFTLLWFGLTGWSMVEKLINCKSSKKYKIKRKFTFFSKYQIYFISWVENIEIFIRAAHSWKFWCFQLTWWNIFGIYLKKVYILYGGQIYLTSIYLYGS